MGLGSRRDLDCILRQWAAIEGLRWSRKVLCGNREEGGMMVKNGSATRWEVAARVLREAVMAVEVGEVDRAEHSHQGRTPGLVHGLGV